MKNPNLKNKTMRKLREFEIDQLEGQGCYSANDEWDRVLVAPEFSCDNIHGCTFSGDIEIGNNVIMHSAHIIASKEYGQYINVINENGGRAIVPSKNLSAECASLWAKFRGDDELVRKFVDMSQKEAQLYTSKDAKTVICDDTFIGHGVQIRNSIIGKKNTVDSAAQLTNVMTGANVSITNAARIFHSYIGSFSHIACCEVANVFAGAFHGQHHNNSFLIAAMIGGLSNVAAGATIGSNHNSRMYDGEIWAKRGFWPGLNVSLKHNSRFASYTMIANGRYNSSLDVKLPFSLAAENKKGGAEIYPAFLISRNLYSLMRNYHKFSKRLGETQNGFIEFDFLAPDTADEMFEAIAILETGGYARANAAADAYKLMLRHYCAKTIFPFMKQNNFANADDLKNALDLATHDGCKWQSFGTLVISDAALSKIIADIKNYKVKTLADTNAIFDSWQSAYKTEKVKHAIAALARLNGITVDALSNDMLKEFSQTAKNDCEAIINLTISSRQKDYTDPHRTMVYDSVEEQNAVLGTLDNDPVIMNIKENFNFFADGKHNK